jgi:hypothetical protein
MEIIYIRGYGRGTVFERQYQCAAFIFETRARTITYLHKRGQVAAFSL